MSAHEAPSLEWIASHYSLLQELEPHLRHDAPHGHG